MAKEIKDHDYVLTPGRYVGAAEAPDDGEPFDEKVGVEIASDEGRFRRLCSKMATGTRELCNGQPDQEHADTTILWGMITSFPCSS